jgi:hypothetical protein
MTNPVPDICECVTYDGERWRVTGWHCLEAIPPCGDDIIGQLMEDIRKKDPETVTHKLVCCTREQATVISLYAVCGAFVRIDEVQREGKYVQWSDKQINEHREIAIRHANSPDRMFDGLGRGYKSTLQRLFPDQNFSYNPEKIISPSDNPWGAEEQREAWANGLRPDPRPKNQQPKPKPYGKLQ